MRHHLLEIWEHKTQYSVGCWCLVEQTRKEVNWALKMDPQTRKEINWGQMKVRQTRKEVNWALKMEPQSWKELDCVLRKDLQFVK